MATATNTWTRVTALNFTYNTNMLGRNQYGVLTCTNGICKINKNGTESTVAGTSTTPVRARAITGEELKMITKKAGATRTSLAGMWITVDPTEGSYYFSNSGYTIGTQTSGTNNKSLAWLIENTKNNTDSGATQNDFPETGGYWQLTPNGTFNESAWRVSSDGKISTCQVGYSGCVNTYGARPVITIPKSLLN
jgi:hypothetical protein